MDTYGFKPCFLVQTHLGLPQVAWPLMRVQPPLRPARGVALPFSDACPPLFFPPFAPASTPPPPHPTLDQLAPAHPLLAHALLLARQQGWRSLELRDTPSWTESSPASVTFHGHTIDLSQGEQTAFDHCDSSIRRSVRQAETHGLRILEAHDAPATRAYFQLHALTRQRHGLPPQPYAFFAALHRHVLAPGHGTILLVLKDQTPIAGAVFLFWNSQAVYKFGASDLAHQALRPNNLLFREALRLGIRRNCTTLDLGRTSLDNQGLRRFKRGWGAVERSIAYHRYDLRSQSFVPTPDRTSGWPTTLFRNLPRPLASLVGKIAYRFAA